MGEPPAGEPYYFQLAELGIYKEQLPVVVDKTALQAAIDEAAEYEGQQNAYTEESWMRFSDALQAANEINEDASAGQDMVDAAAKELCDAIAGLTRKPVEPTDTDRTILEKVLDYAKQAKAGSEYAGVIASVKESFDAAYAQAVSYTHLDVYKRQILPWTLVPMSTGEKTPSWSQSPPLCTISLRRTVE